MSEICPCSTTDHHIGSEVGNQAEPLPEEEKKKKVFCTNLEHVQPQYTPDDAAKTNVCPKMPGSCCLNNMDNNILFRIN